MIDLKYHPMYQQIDPIDAELFQMLPSRQRCMAEHEHFVSVAQRRRLRNAI